MSRRQIVISYDISDPARLQKVYRTVSTLADRIQYSIYYGELLESDLIFLKSELSNIIDPDEDQILFWDHGPVQAVSSLINNVESLGKKLEKQDYNLLIF